VSQIRHAQRRSAQKKHRRSASLNLVSLMDIFTILVFFLMVNSSEVEVLQTSSKIKLPDSTAEKQPDNRLVISLSRDDLVVQGRPVASVADVRNPAVTVIPGLKEELEYQAGRKGEIPEGGFEVTIMGDRELPYWLLKKVMLTCQQTDFARISLAVNRLSGEESPIPAAEVPETAAISGVQASGGAS
jgi:biopolymer transport protein ExbD